MHSIVNLLQPFAKFTSLLSGDEFTTLSCVFPALMELNIHLQEVCYCVWYDCLCEFCGYISLQMKKTADCVEVAGVLQKDLHRCFVKFTAPGVDNQNAVIILL